MPVAPTGRRVDVHVHLSRYWPDLARNSYRPDLEFTVPSLLKELDAQSIGFAVLLQLYSNPTPAGVLREGEEMFAKSAGRLLKTVTIDPTQGETVVHDTVALWERARDLVAIKLYPGYRSFYPHDPRLHPVYEYAHKAGIPVILHQGDTLDPDGHVKYARPLEADEVAVRFRDVRFVLCHLGNPWVEELAEVVYKNANVYTDTSGLLANPRVPYFAEMMRRAQRRLTNALATIGDCHRVLYGSDWPLESIETAVQLITGLDLSPEDQERILGGNARALFRIDPPA
ncbi:MAG: amidohydrolase family protein [Thermoplasmata archaeon]|nr:amidohydrolase family protein [Thermoplasmata archaeon]